MSQNHKEVPQPRPEEPDPYAHLYASNAKGSDRPLGPLKAEHFTPAMGEYTRRLGHTAADTTIHEATGITPRDESEPIRLPGGSHRGSRGRLFGPSKEGTRRKS